MVDGRDLAVMDWAMASIKDVAEDAAAFADPNTTTLIAVAALGNAEISVSFTDGSYNWSDPASGGKFPVREVSSFYFFAGKRRRQDPDPKVKFCGYIAHDHTLVMMDISRGELGRLRLDETRPLQRCP